MGGADRRPARRAGAADACAFRGITEREAVLLQGPAGWGEFAPFVEYGDAESARWLAAAVEAAWAGWPAPRRRLGAGERRPCPRSAPRGRRACWPASPGCTTAKVKVAEAGQGRGRRPGPGRGGPRRARARPGGSGSTPTAAGTSPAAVDALTALARVRAGVRRAAVRDRGGAGRAAPAAGRRAGRRRRGVRRAADPERVALAGAADIVVLKVAPLGGVRAGAAGRRADAGCRSWSPARWRRRSGSPPGSRWPPRCPSCRTPAGWPRSG